MSDGRGWHQANQRQLAAALSTVRVRLQRHAGLLADDPEGPVVDADRALAEATTAMSSPAALDRLCAIFGLSPFERDVLVLCAGIELDGSMGDLCAEAHGEGGRARPTFGLALAALDDPHWSALLPTAPLRRWGLVKLAADGPATAPIDIDERILHYLTGFQYTDVALDVVLEPPPPAPDLTASQQALADVVVASLVSGQPPSAVVHLCGPDTAGKRSVAAAAAGHLELDIPRV